MHAFEKQCKDIFFTSTDCFIQPNEEKEKKTALLFPAGMSFLPSWL